MAGSEIDDWFPLDEEDHHAQVAGLLAMLGQTPPPRPPKRVLDIGCGDGRVMMPLKRAGHEVAGIDVDSRAVEACVAKGLNARRGNVLEPGCDLTVNGAAPDAAVCLGHTFMLFVDPVATLGMLHRVRAAMAPGGWFAVDAFCEPLWNEVAEGYWQSGLAEDGSSQLVWSPGDNVLAFRGEADIDESSWEVRASDRPVRLWSMGELRLLAHGAGFGEPEVRRTDGLIVMRAVR